AVLALNMMDVAETEGVKIDLDVLQRDLGVPVIPMNARKGIGIAALKIVVSQQLSATGVSFFEVPAKLRPMVDQIKERFGLDNDYLALHYAHQYKHLRFLSEEDKVWMAQLLE